MAGKPVWTWITGFADAAVLLPALAFLLADRLVRDRSSLFPLAAGVGVGVGAVLAAKLMFRVCGPGPPVVSPSGHTALALLAAGLWPALSKRWVLALGFALPAGFLVGASRVFLAFHDVREVVLGALCGLTGAVTTAALSRGGPRPPLHPAAVAALAAAFLLLHGKTLDLEPAIAHASGLFRPLGALCSR